ncbi:MAG: Gfo/Idh/MocA family oxidoreductase [Pseudomonadota bacterium]
MSNDKETLAAPRAPQPVRLGMVGGGEGAFIGAVHRIAARLDGHYELVAGALSATRDKAVRSGRMLGLEDERIYSDFELMARSESARADGIEAVAIVTPNHMHAPVARAFLKAGIHVICDKPVTNTSEEARELQALALEHGRIFAVTHNYTGYPMVRQAREMVAQGLLGDIRVVQVEYAQDWLTEALESEGNQQAGWRTDPARSGIGGCISDIGTHAHNLAGFVSGLQVEQLCAELQSFVPGRQLDDNAHVMLRYAGGARGMLWASQVAAGCENNLRLRIYGAKGGLEWQQEHPNQLQWTPYGQARQILSRGSPLLGAAAMRASRIPAGHPEGYLEGFATIYSDIAQAIRAARPGGAAADTAAHFPDIADGIAGIAFVEAVVASSRQGGQWVRFKA